MKTLAIAMLAALSVTAVKAQTKPVKILQNADTLITQNVTWDADTVYFLRGKVYVTNSAELTIQPGTVIVGDTIAKGSLIITRGSKIHAVGTRTCPIVFTSSKASGKKKRGDWGGLIILGNAATNNPGGTQYIEGLAPSPLTQFGGGANPDVHDNSGELNYVRVEFAGVALSPNNEINGITFGAVGDGTLVDFVQVSYANDDSFEFFGGSVNCKHLIAFRGLDDDFDTDNGYNGKLQFGIGLRDPLVADVSGSKGFESDNNATGTTDLPQTSAIFSNFSVSAGADSATNSLFTAGAHIRRNSHILVYNSIIMGYPEALLIDGTLSQNNVLADTLVAHNVIGNTYAPKNVVTASPSGNTAVIDLLQNNAFNRFYTGNTQIQLVNPYSLSKPDFRPRKASPAVTGGNFGNPLLNVGFFLKTTYVGAMNTGDMTKNWATGWINWNPTKFDNRAINAACATPSALTAEAQESVTFEAAKTLQGEASVYPNPARGTFKVNLIGFTGAVNIKVTNANGSTVYNSQTNVTSARTSVDVKLTNAPAGLYFVTISNGKQTTTQKLNLIQ